MILAEHGDEHAGRDSGTDDAGDVRAHGMHEQEVGRVLLLADLLGDAGRHRDGGDAGRADQRVNLLAGQLAHDVAADEAAIALFQQRVDAACVYANASTAFTDGGQFGLGAEIGISTQKLHVRGPFALEGLTSYKYLLSGSGQTRA